MIQELTLKKLVTAQLITVQLMIEQSGQSGLRQISAQKLNFTINKANGNVSLAVEVTSNVAPLTILGIFEGRQE